MGLEPLLHFLGSDFSRPLELGFVLGARFRMDFFIDELLDLCEFLLWRGEWGWELRYILEADLGFEFHIFVLKEIDELLHLDPILIELLLVKGHPKSTRPTLS